ncbi:MAG TPA: amino acid racemase [Chitinophagaceae bacterium]|nr:amino acid racemase [Chitinophagaceae bacterium]
MKPIGLIGGLTYVSTIEYYRYLNELANEKLGGNESAEIIIYSVNFGEIKKLTEAGDWKNISMIICKAAQTIEADGAACLLIGANTMHKIADDVQEAIKIPVIHIAEAVAKEILRNGLKKLGLLGTRYTMQLGFYSDHLARHGIETIIPEQADIDFINYTIYNEFSKNIFLPETKAGYLRVISRLKENGAEGIILGCTEIPILVKQSDCDILLLDTAKIHCGAAVDHVLNL